MEVGEILSWLLAGLVVGAVARLLVPGRQDIGIVLTIVLGIVGAIVGGVLYNLIRHGSVSAPGGFNMETAWQGWIFAILGGVLVVWLVSAIMGRRSYP